MDKKQVKQILINLNKNFPTKTLQKTTVKHINKNKATTINNIESATKKSTPQKPTTPQILDPKTHWLDNNHPIPSTTNLLLKQMEVLSVV
jgi:hypothetical protein